MRTGIFIAIFLLVAVGFTSESFAKQGGRDKNDGDWTVFGIDMYSHENVTGNVGIGTTSPEWKLHIVGDHPLLIDNTGSPANDSILFRRFGVNQYTLGITNEPSFFLYDQVAQNFRFTISSNGNFGIGTTNPQAKIHIGGDSGVDGLMFPDGTLQTTAANSSGSSLWATNSSDIYNTNSGKVGIGTTSPGWKLHVVGAGPLLLDNVSATNNDSILFKRFGVNQYTLGVTSEPSFFIFDQVAKTFRFALISNGNVGISDTAPSERLSVGGNIKATGTITQGSSRELKEGITMISTKEAIETLQGLNPIKFKYKAEDSGEEHLGFIAEDVPDLVAFKDRKRLSSMDMTAVLVRVVKEQQRVIKEQQKNMDTMTQEIEKMKLTMNTL